MALTHLHLLLNHVPTVGMGSAMALFLISIATKRDHPKEASLVLFLGVALLTIPTLRHRQRGCRRRSARWPGRMRLARTLTSSADSLKRTKAPRFPPC